VHARAADEGDVAGEPRHSQRLVVGGSDLASRREPNMTSELVSRFGLIGCRSLC
jgi:hypothetical protein